MEIKNKSIVFIPPDGELIAQDFALYRVINYFKELGLSTSLITTNNTQVCTKKYDVNHIVLNNKDEIINHLSNNKYDLIFHRSWMHRYEFAAEIAKKFDNVISYIKDWHDFPRKKYKFIYDTVEDVDAMREIIKNSKIILSHYSNEYTDLLAKKHHVDKRKFYFFPEYTNRSHFSKKNVIEYDKDHVKLVLAGGGVHTGVPNHIVPGKSLFYTLHQIANQKIYIDMVIVKKSYMKMKSNRKMYLDYLYEDKFNKYFSIKKGQELDSSLGLKYHFGIFGDSNFPDDALYTEAEAYGVTSKFSFYLECGLPVLVNERFKTLANIVEKNNIGLVFSDNDLVNFKSFLKISTKDYKKLVKNIYKFREKFTYNKKTMKSILDLL